MKKVISLFLVVLLTITLAACGGNDDPQDIIDDVLDCVADPSAEGCDEIIPDPTDDRTVEEILADAIIENWDGETTHLNTLLDALDFAESMELQAEFNFQALDSEDVEHIINVVLTDSYVFLPGDSILNRNVSMNIDGEMVDFTMIFEEVPTGVIIYLEISNLRDLLEEENSEANEVVTVLGVDTDWLKFSFNDTLVNMIEIEVMREILSQVFFSEMGLTVFYDLEDNIELDTGLTLADYNLDIGLIMDKLSSGDYSGFVTMFEGIDFDTLLFDLDGVILVPKLVEFLTENQTDLETEGFDVVNGIIYLEANGTEAYLGSLSETDITTFISILTAPDKMNVTMRNLEQQMPWQVISVLDLPIEDLETGALITWVSNNPTVITNAGVVTPHATEWRDVGFVATVTIGTEVDYFHWNITVPPLDAVGFGDEYYDDHYDDRDNDPIGDFLKDTVDFYDIILFIKDMKDNLLLVDFDALELESVDYIALKDAFYESETAYNAYIVTLTSTAPESAKILGTFNYVAKYFEENIFIVDVKYVIDNLDMFEKYITLDYYLDNDLVDISIDKTDVFAIETTMELAPDAFGSLLENVLVDVSVLLGGITEFEIPYIEHIYCPIGETCEELDGYDNTISRLNDLSHFEMVATYDPSSPSELVVKLDFTDLLDAIINIELFDNELLDRAIDELRSETPWRVISMINLPTSDVENEAIIIWTSDDPSLITSTGVVTPHATEWRGVNLTAVVTVGLETDTLYFYVEVPPLTETELGDEYYYYDNGNNGMDISSVIDLSFTVTVKENATVTIPTSTNDVNAIAEDFARFSLSMMAFDYLDRIGRYYSENPSELIIDLGETKSLEFYVDEFFVTHAFDSELSNVVLGGTLLNPELSIELVWLDGTDVFVAPLTFAELLVVVGPGTGGPATNAVFEYYINRVDDTNFNMTKLLFVYIFNDEYEED